MERVDFRVITELSDETSTTRKDRVFDSDSTPLE